MIPKLTADSLPAEFDDLSPRRKRQIAEYINRQLSEILSQAVDQTMELMLALPITVLYDYWGFRKIRLERFLGQVQTRVKAVSSDPNAMSEYVKIAQQEAGYELVLLNGKEE